MTLNTKQANLVDELVNMIFIFFSFVVSGSAGLNTLCTTQASNMLKALNLTLAWFQASRRDERVDVSMI